MKIAVKCGRKVSDNIYSSYDNNRAQGEDIMPALATYPATASATSAEPTRITTTLYDLVDALSAEAAPEDDCLVTAAVMHLINSGRARFVGSRKTLAIVDA
jgi:hypothetical protein